MTSAPCLCVLAENPAEEQAKRRKKKTRQKKITISNFRLCGVLFVWYNKKQGGTRVRVRSDQQKIR